jgi:hypothetical protein
MTCSSVAKSQPVFPGQPTSPIEAGLQLYTPAFDFKQRKLDKTIACSQKSVNGSRGF